MSSKHQEFVIGRPGRCGRKVCSRTQWICHEVNATSQHHKLNLSIKYHELLFLVVLVAMAVYVCACECITVSVRLLVWLCVYARRLSNVTSSICLCVCVCLCVCLCLCKTERVCGLWKFNPRVGLLAGWLHARVHVNVCEILRQRVRVWINVNIYMHHIHVYTHVYIHCYTLLHTWCMHTYTFIRVYTCIAYMWRYVHL